MEAARRGAGLTEAVPYGAIESEQLGWGSPWLAPSDWIPLLGEVIARQREAGRRRFLVAATTETAEEARGVVEAVGAERVHVVCLDAPPDTVVARIAAREPDGWPGKAALIDHARRLARSIPELPGIDLVIDTDGRESPAVAAEVRDALPARGILEPL